MAVTTLTTRMSAGINYTHVTDSSADWSSGSLPINTYFYDKADKLTHFKDSNGNIIEIFGNGAVGVCGISNSNGLYTFYNTLTEAMAVATNKTIELFADITETSAVTIAMANGVTIQGNGHTYTLDVAGAVNAFTIAQNFSCYIFNAILKIKTSTGSLIVMGIDSTLRGDAILSGTSTIPTSTGLSYILQGVSSTTPINVSGFTIIAEASKSGVYIGNGSFADNLEIYSDTGQSFVIGGSAQARNCNIYAKNPSNSMFGTKPSAVYLGGSLTKSFIQTGGANATVAVYLQISNPATQPKGVYNCDIISLTGDGLNVENAADIEDCRITVYGAGKKTITTEINAETVYVDVHNCILRSINGPCVEQKLKWASFTDCYLYAGNGSGIINLNDNPTYDTMRLIKCFIEIATSNSTYHGVVLGTGTTVTNEITNCYFSVVNAASYAIHALGATTAKCAQNAFKGSTVPINPLITNTSNIIDTQGNVII